MDLQHLGLPRCHDVVRRDPQRNEHVARKPIPTLDRWRVLGGQPLVIECPVRGDPARMTGRLARRSSPKAPTGFATPAERQLVTAVREPLKGPPLHLSRRRRCSDALVDLWRCRRGCPYNCEAITPAAREMFELRAQTRGDVDEPRLPVGGEGLASVCSVLEFVVKRVDIAT